MGTMASILGTTSFGGRGGGPLRCSFCGRRDTSVDHLVRARGVYICDGCVAQAHAAVASAAPGQKLLRIRPTPGAVADRDASEAAVEWAFETVFGPESSVEERCRAIAGGENLAPAMHELHGRYQPADVSVEYVRFLTDDEAEVHFTLFVSQFGPSGLRQTGHAVRVGDAWKVSRDTWCGLVRMAGVECPPPPD
jgi:ClpX C4-type zinc finger